MIEVVDNTNSLGFAGYELMDMATIPPRTFAIGLHKEDAERLAACMNACIGIPTETLKRGLLQALLGRLRAHHKALAHALQSAKS